MVKILFGVFLDSLTIPIKTPSIADCNHGIRFHDLRKSLLMLQLKHQKPAAGTLLFYYLITYRFQLQIRKNTGFDESPSGLEPLGGFMKFRSKFSD